jgi:hypothetical protein
MTTDGWVSFIVALVFGIPGFLAWLISKRTKIVFLEKRVINLKDDLLKSFDELSIRYKGVEVQSNVYIISGFLLCTGNKDIDHKNSAIEISIPDNSKWLDFKIIQKPKNMELQHHFLGNDLTLTFDLLKSTEFIEFESIVEINAADEKIDSNKILRLYHRIPNVPKIERKVGDTLAKSKNIIFMGALLAIFSLFMYMYLNTVKPYQLKIYDSLTHIQLDEDDFRYTELAAVRSSVAEGETQFSLSMKGRTGDFKVRAYDELIATEPKKIRLVYFGVRDWNFAEVALGITVISMFLCSVFYLIAGSIGVFNNRKYLSIIKN